MKTEGLVGMDLAVINTDRNEILAYNTYTTHWRIGKLNLVTPCVCPPFSLLYFSYLSSTFLPAYAFAVIIKFFTLATGKSKLTHAIYSAFVWGK